MSRHQTLKKIIASVLVFLFVGLTVKPVESVLKASQEDTKVEVTTQVFNVKEFRTITISLSNQQYQKLKLYLIDLNARLNTTTKEETVSVFKEAIAEINKYGLLPEGMSVEQAQRLVSGCNQKSKMKRDYLDIFPNLENMFCFLSATATKIPDYVPSPVILPFGLLLLFSLFPAFLVSMLGNQELADSLAELGLSVWNSNPFRVFNLVFFLGYSVELHSFGLKGVVNNNLLDGVVFRGYSGLMLSLSDSIIFFFGFAINVISPN